MVTAKQVINSIKPNITKVPKGNTKLGSAGYDNPRDDIERVKKMREGSCEKVPTFDNDITNKKYVDDEIDADILTHKGDADAHHPQAHTHTHVSTTGRTANDHHAESHTIVSHSDTSATGAELDTLTDNSIANTLHRHSELVASDGSPDPAVSVDASGNVNIQTGNVRIFRPSDTTGKFEMTRVSDGWSLGSVGFTYPGGYGGDLDLRVHPRNGVLATAPVSVMYIASTGTGGNVGIEVTDPHSKLEVNGAISSATSTFSTTGPTDNVDVSGINTLFIDATSNAVVIGGFSGGVNGQVLHIVKCCATANNVTLEHNEGGGSQDIFLHAGADETLHGEYGGWVLVCNGSDFFDASHSRHV